MNFKQLRKILNMNQTQFAEKLGIHQQTVAMIEHEKRDVPKTARLNFFKQYGISYEEAINCQNEEELKQILNKTKLNKNFNETNIAAIPFYRVGAAAGVGVDFVDTPPDTDYLYFDERWLKNILGVNPENLILIFADGDSMDSGFDTKEDIKDKDLLLIDTSQKSGNNKIFVLLVNDIQLRVKRLFKKLDGGLVLMSNNPKYPEEVYYPDSNDITIQVIGKVVWNGSKENI